jgi:adenine-specific DNA-methyltransferase
MSNRKLPAAHLLACESNQSFLARLPDGCAKLVATSPPYNIGKSYERKSPLDQYLDEQRPVIAEAVRVMHPQGSLCWQVGNYVNTDGVVPLDIVLYPLFTAHGLKLKNRIIWHFGHGLHCRKRLSGRHETILWFVKQPDYTFHLDPIRVPAKYPQKRYYKGPKIGQLSCNPLGKNPTDVWEFPNVKHNHCEKTEHPCQFPVELPERLVLALTDPGDLVIDPHVGVGSTVLAAAKHGRIGYGCDLSPRYIKIARQRLDALNAGTLLTRPIDRPVWQPKLCIGG